MPCSLLTGMSKLLESGNPLHEGTGIHQLADGLKGKQEYGVATPVKAFSLEDDPQLGVGFLTCGKCPREMDGRSSDFCPMLSPDKQS